MDTDKKPINAEAQRTRRNAKTKIQTLQNSAFSASLRFIFNLKIHVYRRLRIWRGCNPKGIESFSPGLAAQRTTLGNRPKSFSTPTGLHRRRARTDSTLSGLYSF